MPAPSIAITYTEVTHTVILDLPAGLPPVEADSGWEFQPARLSLKYTIRSHVNPSRWQVRQEITGPWLPKGGHTRTGTACLLPVNDLPAWLGELANAHWPTWTPELPVPLTGVTLEATTESKEN